ncbi:MAG: hypothetical protein H7274_05560 [Rhodoferax sp.]|nr:hypothetical protein [Rhodoferax sp.]
MQFRLLAAMAAAFVTTLATAAGPYDGIYNVPNTAEFLSVHQNGNHVIIGGFSTVPASGVVFYLGDGQVFPPDRADNWELFSGDISGSTVVVTGEMAFGACEADKRLVFTGSAVVVTQLFIRTTPIGYRYGVSCPSYQNYFVSRLGITRTYIRVF